MARGSFYFRLSTSISGTSIHRRVRAYFALYLNSLGFPLGRSACCLPSSGGAHLRTNFWRWLSEITARVAS